jgi:hypothetical protein
MVSIKNKLFQTINLVDKNSKIIFLPPRNKIKLNINIENISVDMKNLMKIGYIQIKEE